MKELFVVIPNWNGADLIDECLAALQRQTLAHDVIVVDNGSVDGSNLVVREKFPSVQLLEYPDNAGFAGGVNRGIRPAMEQGAEYVALLNNDAVADERWLERLVEAAEADPRVGAVAAKILTMDGKRLDSTGDFYSVWGSPFSRGRGEEDRGQYDAPEQREIFTASGGASLYRTEMFRQVGLFDERFFAYYEDTDIGFRGRLAGWKMVYEPSAVVRHHLGATSSRVNEHEKIGETPLSAPSVSGRVPPSPFARYHLVKNFVYVFTKNMPGRLYWKYLPRFLAGWAMMLALDLKRGMWASNVKASATALVNLPSILADRRRIQRGRTVTPGEIDRLLYHAITPWQRERLHRLGTKKHP